MAASAEERREQQDLGEEQELEAVAAPDGLLSIQLEVLRV